MVSTLIVIFCLQVSYVTVLTIRTILTIKGYRYPAAILSAVDVLIYVIGFKIVLDNLDKPINLVIYCVSYGVGILVGMYVEERLALGYVNINVITKEEHRSMVQILRDQGYGVTTWNGDGLQGQRLIISITTQKKNQYKCCKLINEVDQDAFVVTSEQRHYQGGFSLNPFRQHYQKDEAKAYM